MRLLEVEHDVKLALRTARACGDGERREARGERGEGRGERGEVRGERGEVKGDR